MDVLTCQDPRSERKGSTMIKEIIIHEQQFTCYSIDDRSWISSPQNKLAVMRHRQGINNKNRLTDLQIRRIGILEDIDPDDLHSVGRVR